jgi:hypothetical protein
MPRPIAQSAVVRYGVALASVTTAVVLALALQPVALAFKYHFTPPFDSLTVNLAEVPRLVIFTLIAAFGKMSMDMVRMDARLRTAICSARTTNVLGRRSATIHIGSVVPSPSPF